MNQNSGFWIVFTQEFYCIPKIQGFMKKKHLKGKHNFRERNTLRKRNTFWKSSVLTIRPLLTLCHCQLRGYRQCRAPYMLKLYNHKISENQFSNCFSSLIVFECYYRKMKQMQKAYGYFMEEEPTKPKNIQMPVSGKESNSDN